MKREQIVELLNSNIKIQECYNPRRDTCDQWIEGIDKAADAILALPIEVPSEEEIECESILNGTSQMKTTKTYPIICPSCRGAKVISNPNFNPYTDDLLINCPACIGTGIVTCTETTEETIKIE